MDQSDVESEKAYSTPSASEGQLDQSPALTQFSLGAILAVQDLQPLCQQAKS